MNKPLVALAASFFVAAFWAILLWLLSSPTVLTILVAALSGLVTFIVIATFMGGDTRGTLPD